MPPRRCRGQRAAGAWRGGRRRVRPLLVWGALTLLAALALALALVLAGLVVAPADPAPPPKPPMHFGPSVGHPRPQ
jgi:hypothetical protein